MTTRTISSHSKKIILSISATLMLSFLFSCAKKTTAIGKSETPAPTEATTATTTIPETKGMVLIKRDVNSNYVVQINLRELEASKQLDPASSKSYIVWMDTDNRKPINLGQINSNTGWLTDKSKASFEGVSEFKPTKVFITTEDNATVKTPGKQIVWSTNRF